MPRNSWTYLGMRLIVGSALVWLGAALAQTVEWLLPYTSGAGVALLVIGVFLELRVSRRKKLLAP